MFRLLPALSALILIAGCSQPGFIETGEVGPAPPLLPVEEILAEGSPHLDAEATAALEARAAALRDRAGLPAAEVAGSGSGG
ncbi:hypothetical protein C0V75_17745 [Tabrizicola sp. TH137]|uniref:hypothetical protein n=1 Tax=Tabrizicola sp. TH137 TaxID=2067452 RepID=UPI000C7DB532|nr:hypothetical protein [Tabrizicola sp. TH137]PLL11129.1 hypothetical protein C0V75_17745 [Tabrizicola sp. TH137]